MRQEYIISRCCRLLLCTRKQILQPHTKVFDVVYQRHCSPSKQVGKIHLDRDCPKIVKLSKNIIHNKGDDLFIASVGNRQLCEEGRQRGNRFPHMLHAYEDSSEFGH